MKLYRKKNLIGYVVLCIWKNIKFNLIIIKVGGNMFPCVVKVGHAHNGLGKVKVESNNGFQVEIIIEL